MQTAKVRASGFQPTMDRIGCPDTDFSSAGAAANEISMLFMAPVGIFPAQPSSWRTAVLVTATIVGRSAARATNLHHPSFLTYKFWRQIHASDNSPQRSSQ